MSTFFFVLLAAVALAVCAARPDSPQARTRQQMAARLRSLGWRRVAGLALLVVVGVFALPLVTSVRVGLHGVLVALACGTSWLAGFVALDRHYLPRAVLEVRP